MILIMTSTTHHQRDKGSRQQQKFHEKTWLLKMNISIIIIIIVVITIIIDHHYIHKNINHNLGVGVSSAFSSFQTRLAIVFYVWYSFESTLWKRGKRGFSEYFYLWNADRGDLHSTQSHLSIT